MSHSKIVSAIRKLIAQYSAVNLTTGFPDIDPPIHIKEALLRAAKDPNLFSQQYTLPNGHPRLVNALASLYSKRLKHEINPTENIVITLGGFQALFFAIHGLINPGDEVIIIEPAFACYREMTEKAGGVPVYVSMRPTNPDASGMMSSSNWSIDAEELANSFTDKTKAIILNNPHNPTGKVFTLKEMEMIASLCIKHDIIVISDEVYEWVVYDDHQFVNIASLPNMWERTMSVGSGGKTFGVTGWRIGWVIAPDYLARIISLMNQHCQGSLCKPIQEALGELYELEILRLKDPTCHFNIQSKLFSEKRNFLIEALQSAAISPIKPMAGYFIVANISNIDFPYDKNDGRTKDVQFVSWMIKEKGIAAMPVSIFYSEDHAHYAKDLVRFCFTKAEPTLNKVAELLRR